MMDVVVKKFKQNTLVQSLEFSALNKLRVLLSLLQSLFTTRDIKEGLALEKD